jgi:hypothetical protein
LEYTFISVGVHHRWLFYFDLHTSQVAIVPLSKLRNILDSCPHTTVDVCISLQKPIEEVLINILKDIWFSIVVKPIANGRTY